MVFSGYADVENMNSGNCVSEGGELVLGILRSTHVSAEYPVVKPTKWVTCADKELPGEAVERQVIY